jgi:hypothetical protein
VKPLVLKVRARVLAYEGTDPFGFFFDVRTATPNQEYAIGFTPSLVTDPLGNCMAIDATVFHEYVLRATPGGPYALDIDGQFAFGGPFSATGGALNAIQIGDGNSVTANARAEITKLEFSQGTVTLNRQSGDRQTYTVLTQLPNPLVLMTANPDGSAAPNIAIAFSLTAPAVTGYSLTNTTAMTGGDGTASTQLTLGDVPGQYLVTASWPLIPARQIV